MARMRHGKGEGGRSTEYHVNRSSGATGTESRCQHKGTALLGTGGARLPEEIFEIFTGSELRQLGV